MSRLKVEVDVAERGIVGRPCPCHRPNTCQSACVLQRLCVPKMHFLGSSLLLYSPFNHYYSRPLSTGVPFPLYYQKGGLLSQSINRTVYFHPCTTRQNGDHFASTLRKRAKYDCLNQCQVSGCCGRIPGFTGNTSHTAQTRRRYS